MSSRKKRKRKSNLCNIRAYILFRLHRTNQCKQEDGDPQHAIPTYNNNEPSRVRTATEQKKTERSDGNRLHVCIASSSSRESLCTNGRFRSSILTAPISKLSPQRRRILTVLHPHRLRQIVFGEEPIAGEEGMRHGQR